jgi:hypothetical protein
MSGGVHSLLRCTSSTNGSAEKYLLSKISQSGLVQHSSIYIKLLRTHPFSRTPPWTEGDEYPQQGYSTLPVPFILYIEKVVLYFFACMFCTNKEVDFLCCVILLPFSDRSSREPLVDVLFMAQ